MHHFLEMQKQLLPELIELLKKRYTVLHQIMLSNPIGRRTLATLLQMTERVLRAETDLLKAQGLIDMDNMGMRITDEGRQLMRRMESMMGELLGMRQLEENIRQAFDLKQVIVVPGNSDVSLNVKQELGQAACKALGSIMGKKDIVAVTGGSMLAAMANQFKSRSPLKGNWFVPARGGLGESLEYQANTIASTMAKQVGAQYRLLHVPDLLSKETYQSLKQEPDILDILRVIRQARIVVHGIGEAFVMAKRRRMDEETIQKLLREGALAEAFGYYFDRDGNVVNTMLTLGLRLEDLTRIEVVIAIAGGQSKGESIAAVLRAKYEDILVIDEAAAVKVLEVIRKDRS